MIKKINLTCTPWPSATFVKYLNVPPYTSFTEIKWEPLLRRLTTVAVVTLPEENARPCISLN
jgi:hypothetical protein